MSFAAFPNIDRVAKAYQIVCARGEFVEPLPFTVSEHLRSELNFVQEEIAVKRTEAAICENLLYPVLKEVWKPFSDVLGIWSHEPLDFDNVLCGVPDYLVTRRSPLGRLIPDQPFLVVFEAKRDDFALGWGQCLAAMVAAQNLNADPDQAIYGIVSNGSQWEFGRLLQNTFTEHPSPWSLYELDELAAALHFVFAACKEQAIAQPQPA